MAHPIADSLLDQAREHLAKSDFANAAKSARAVLALDSENSDAHDILKASEAAIGVDSANDESVIKNNLTLDLTRLDDEQLERLENLTEEQLSEINVPPTNPQSESVYKNPYFWVVMLIILVVGAWNGYTGYFFDLR